jgi:hypothetical protein
MSLGIVIWHDLGRQLVILAAVDFGVWMLKDGRHM